MTHCCGAGFFCLYITISEISQSFINAMYIYTLHSWFFLMLKQLNFGPRCRSSLPFAPLGTSSLMLISFQYLHLVQFSSVAQSCPTLCDPMNRSTPGLPVHHRLPEFTKTHVHRVRDAIQPSHPRLSPSPPAPNPSQYQSLFQWVNSSHEVAKVLDFQL